VTPVMRTTQGAWGERGAMHPSQPTHVVPDLGAGHRPPRPRGERAMTRPVRSAEAGWGERGAMHPSQPTHVVPDLTLR
jgi:hypothetical protein